MLLGRLTFLLALVLALACAAGPGAREGDDPAECKDGADNDDDGRFDCDDVGCNESPDCAVESSDADTDADSDADADADSDADSDTDADSDADSDADADTDSDADS